MPQNKNLRVQRCAGPKSLPNRGKERENGREHGLRNLLRWPPKFKWVNENQVFGRHRWTMSRLFISYSRRNAKEINLLSQKLEAAGHQVWLDRSAIEGGAQWQEEVVR